MRFDVAGLGSLIIFSERHPQGFPGSSAGKKSAATWETSVRLQGWEDALEIGIPTDRVPTPVILGFPGGSDGKESFHNAGDRDSTPVLGRSPGEGQGNPLQYSCLENSMNRGFWRAAVSGDPKSQTQLSA